MLCYTVNFSQSSYEVMENANTVTLIIELSQPSPKLFHVVIDMTDISAKGI